MFLFKYDFPIIIYGQISSNNILILTCMVGQNFAVTSFAASLDDFPSNRLIPKKNDTMANGP